MNRKFKQLSDKAFELHTNKLYKEAEILYIKLLEIKPDDVNILNLYGLLCISESKYDLAIELLSKAMVLKKSAYVASNLAKAYYFKDDIEKSILIYKQALQFEQTDDIYYSLALAYKKINNIDETIKNYLIAIKLNPNNTSAMYNLASLYQDLGDIDNAIKYANFYSNVLPNDYGIHVFLSSCYEKKEDYISAINELQNAIYINPDNNIYYFNCAVLYDKLNNKVKAIEYYKKSIEISPTYYMAYVNLSYLLKDSQLIAAISYLQTAYNINSNDSRVCIALANIYKSNDENKKSINVICKFLKMNKFCAEGYSVLASNCMALSKYKFAYKYYCMALAINPNEFRYLHGKAVALKYLGNENEAMKILKYIVDNNDSDFQSSIVLGMMYLKNKQFKQGYELYLKRSNTTKLRKIYNEKLWTPNIDLKNKKLLVYSDCGLGDTIMYSRYLNQLALIADSVTLQTDKVLKKILANCFPQINVISKTEQCINYDVIIPIMNLQYILNMDFENIPHSDMYLTADNDSVVKFSNLDILKTSKKKIGIFRKGNNKIFKNRQIKESEFSKLFELDNCNFYSFQIENDLIESENIISLKPYINDYNDTAALLKNMDILITVDSSICHMAGALGIKTFLLLPHTAEWRWFNDNINSSWYKSVKIFRQTSSRTWKEPIDKIYSELLNL